VKNMCGAARRIAWGDAGPREASDELLSARAHVAGCADCQAFLRDMDRLSLVASQSATRESVPPALRSRLMSVAAGSAAATAARAARRITPLRVAALAAAGVVLLLGGALLRGVILPDPASANVRLLAEVVSEHGRARSGDRLESGDPAQIKTWIASRVAFGVHVPVFSDAVLRAVRLEDLGGRRGVAIEYQRNGELISYVIAPDSVVAVPQRSAAGIPTATVRGYRLAWWSEPGLVHAMVGDVAASELRALAEECIRQVMALQRKGTARLPEARAVRRANLVSNNQLRGWEDAG
jgi:anti-sigma factor RsiW